MSRGAVVFAVLFGAIFAAFGLVFVIHAGFLAADELALDRSTHAEGVVLAATKGSPTVEFRAADGKLVRFVGPSRDSSYKGGERLATFYDPREPEKATLKSPAQRLKDLVTAGVVGAGFAIAGIVVGVRALRRYRQIRHLLRHGLRLEGSVIGFEREKRRSSSIGRKGSSSTRTVWFVVVEWTDHAGQRRRERSDVLSEDPSKKFSGEDNVIVLVDPTNPDVFWIDLDGESKNVSPVRR
jgi:hypothetical protein